HNVTVPGPEGTSIGNPHARFDELIETACLSVRECVARIAGAGQFPLVLGGDHSIAMGTVAGLLDAWGEVGVLWVDAHGDINTPQTSPSGNVHGMPVACLAGFGPPELTGLGGTTPAISPGWVRQIGVRSVDEGERRFVHAQGLDVFDMRHIDELGMRATMEQALAGVDADTHLHVSFDVDFLDPEIAPGVGTQVRGGPTYREAQLCMEMIADTGRLGSLDVVELNPAFDVRNRTALLAVDLIESLFGKSTLMRRPVWQAPAPQAAAEPRRDPTRSAPVA
ncbi:MAG: arginase, partial [Gammaproteobacteria bacterium]|nr:arginase [Gammaproteobacteria bacterium]